MNALTRTPRPVTVDRCQMHSGCLIVSRVLWYGCANVRHEPAPRG